MKCTVFVTVYLFGTIFGAQVTFLPRPEEEGNQSDDRMGKNKKGKVPRKWLTDSILYDDYQSDSPVDTATSMEVCPPVPPDVSDDACAEANCNSDIDCDIDFRCCFTGCAFTCVPEIKPAAVVDWKKEPRRSRSGISWLIDGPVKTVGTEETCSTTPVGKDEDPLLCPSGYFCHVTDPGNPKKGKPNSGYCVKQNEGAPQEEEIVLSAALSGIKTCKMDNIVLLDGAKLRLPDRKCRCKHGYLSCSKKKKKTKVDVKVKPKTQGRKHSKVRKGSRKNKSRS